MKFMKLIKITIPALVFCVVFSVSAFCATPYTFRFRPYNTSPLAVGSYYLENRPGYSGSFGTNVSANAVFNYSTPSTLSPVMAAPVALEYRSDIQIGDSTPGRSGYFVFDTGDLRSAPSLAESSTYYGIDVLGYNTEPEAYDLGISISEGGYYTFNLTVGISIQEDFLFARHLNVYAIPVFAIYGSSGDPAHQGVFAPLYFVYGGGLVSGSWLGEDGAFWDNDSSYYFDAFSFNFVLDGASSLGTLANMIDLSAYGDIYFSGFRFAICSDVFDFNEKPFIAFPNTVGGSALTADEYANVLTKMQIEQANKNTEEVIGAINSPIDNTPINDFESIEGSSGDDAEGVVQDVWDYFDINGNILADNSPLKNAFLLVGNQFTFIFGANPYTIWLFMFVLVIILIGVVVRRGIFSSGTSAVNRFRNRRNRKE